MKTLLQIRSSIFSDRGQSSRLAERFVASWRAASPRGKVVVRDLAREPMPHVDATRFGAFPAKPGERTPKSIGWRHWKPLLPEAVEPKT